MGEVGAEAGTAGSQAADSEWERDECYHPTELKHVVRVVWRDYYV